MKNKMIEEVNERSARWTFYYKTWASLSCEDAFPTLSSVTGCGVVEPFKLQVVLICFDSAHRRTTILGACAQLCLAPGRDHVIIPSVMREGSQRGVVVRVHWSHRGQALHVC
jgi:hypothetical protein